MSMQSNEHTSSNSTTVLVLCVIGLGILLAADWCANLVATSTRSSPDIIGGFLFRPALVLGCMLGMVRPHWLDRISQAPRALWIISILLLVGEIIQVCDPTASLHPIIVGARAVVSGFCYALLLLVWLAQFRRFEPKWAATLFASSYLVVAVVYFVLAAVGREIATIVVALLPFVSGLLCVLLVHLDRATSLHILSDVVHRPLRHEDWRFIVYPTALMIAFKFVFNFSLAFSNGATMHGPLGILVVCLFALVWALFFFENFNPSVLYKAALPSMVAGIIALMWVYPANNAATFASNAGNIAFELYLLIVLIDACRRFEVNPFWLFGIVEGAAYLSSWLGRVIGRAFVVQYPLGSPESNITMMLMVVGLVALSVFIFSERIVSRAFGEWAHNSSRVENMDVTSSPAPLMGTALGCAAVARSFGLSRREEDVLELLAQGMSTAQIQEELCVSHSTVKSHIQHIYEKVGVHSRDEVRAVVESSRIS